MLCWSFENIFFGKKGEKHVFFKHEVILDQINNLEVALFVSVRIIICGRVNAAPVFGSIKRIGKGLSFGA